MSTNICIITRPDLEPAVHGAAVKIMETARALSRLGADVVIVTNDRLWYYHVVGGAVAPRRYPQPLLSLTNLPPFLKQKLARLPVPGYWETIRRLLTRAGYPRDEQFLYQAAVDPDFWIRVLYVGRRHRVTVYQAEFPGYAVPAWLAARVLGGQCALVEHNVEYLRLRDTTELPSSTIEKLKRIEAWLAGLVDHVIAVSEPDRLRLAALGIPEARIRVIPHGVNLEAYADVSGQGIRARYGIQDDDFLLVFHGTLHYWPNTVAVKHIAEDLLPRLEARGVPAKAMVCGVNPPRYYAHPRMVFTGVVQDLPQHLAAADVAVVPLDDGGGTRLKILEYFAAGLPVVSRGSRSTRGRNSKSPRIGTHLPMRLPVFGTIGPGLPAWEPQVVRLWPDTTGMTSVGPTWTAMVCRSPTPARPLEPVLPLEEGRRLAGVTGTGRTGIL